MMYKELIFGAVLREGTPIEVINGIKYMGGVLEEMPEGFQEKIFKTLFQESSCFFGVDKPIFDMWQDEFINCWTINARVSSKNEDREIEQFLEWVEPYILLGSGKKEIYAITIGEEDIEPTVYFAPKIKD